MIEVFKVAGVPGALPDGWHEYVRKEDYDALELRRQEAQAAWDRLLLANDRQCQYVLEARQALHSKDEARIEAIANKLPMHCQPTQHRIQDLEAALRKIIDGNPRHTLSSPNGTQGHYISGMYDQWQCDAQIARAALTALETEPK